MIYKYKIYINCIESENNYQCFDKYYSNVIGNSLNSCYFVHYRYFIDCNLRLNAIIDNPVGLSSSQMSRDSVG